MSSRIDTIVNYFKLARAFNERFPSFETDIHGLVKGEWQEATLGITWTA
jgi:hypothetical protein